MGTSQAESQLIEKFQLAHQYIDNLRQEIHRHVIGYHHEIDILIASIIANGHSLLVGMPGVGKTRLVKVIAQALGINFKRIQATPDLMPSDIIGTEILNRHNSEFEFMQGPIFCQFLMIDEINRATPRTQSALLEAMQEYQISISGRIIPLPQPFYVIATQNPIEQDGTFQLPEAQLDRFMCRIDIPYPDNDQERNIIVNTVITPNMDNTPKVNPIVNDQFLLQIRQLVQHMPISEGILQASLNLVRQTRDMARHENSYILRGAGPRAGQYLIALSRALALVRGHMLVTAEDINDCVIPVIQHRVALHYGLGILENNNDITSQLHDMMYKELSNL